MINNITMCDICGAEGGVKLRLDNDTYETLCYNCVNKVLADKKGVIFRGQYYKEGHPDVRHCDYCDGLAHVELWNSSHHRCLYCATRRIQQMQPTDMIYCHKCGIIHSHGMCDGNLCDTEGDCGGSLSFTVRKDSKSRDAKGGYKSNYSYIKSIGQYQTERTLDPETAKMLGEFYHNTEKFTHYYTREPIHIEGTVSYKNTRAMTQVRDLLSDMRCRRDRNIANGKKVSKYSNMYIQGMDDNGLVKRKFIDIMGNVRERCESVNKFLKDCGRDATNENMTGHFRYVLSSDIKHKIKAFKLNEKVGSCQKSHNYSSYARGAYDAITNGCNCPILLYAIGSTEPFARITTRIMYDRQGQEYILIDRIYHSGEFSDNLMRGTIYKAIVKDLKEKGYKVIASNYSAHDNSTYSYLASLGMKSDTIVEDLCQPLRRLIGGYGYYSDGGIVVYGGEIDLVFRATDYLDKAYVL